MKITHKIDDFLLELFPQYKKSNLDLSILKEEITKYFTVEPYKPQVMRGGGRAGWRAGDGGRGACGADGRAQPRRGHGEDIAGACEAGDRAL